MIPSSRRHVLALLAGTALLSGAAAEADEAADAFPSRPLRIIVGFGAGGSSDLLARLVGEAYEKRWGQQVVVENRTGAQGNIAMVAVAKAPPDGTTLALVPVGNAAVNPSLFKDLPYDTQRDFAPVSLLANVENVLVVAGKHPARTLKEFVELGRRGGATLTYSSPGAGSQAHLAGELLARGTGLALTHVPYRGLNQALTDVLSGEITMTFAQLSLALPFIENGGLRALGVASKTRSPALPNVPTIAEAGDLPGFEAVSWYALMVPARTPDGIVRKLATEAARIVRAPELGPALAAQGMVPVGSTPEELAQVIRVDTARWAKIIAEANIQVR